MLKIPTATRSCARLNDILKKTDIGNTSEQKPLHKKLAVK